MHYPAEPRFSAHERKHSQRYLRELGSSIAIYVLLLLPSLIYGPDMAAGAAKTAVLTAPMLGFFLMIWAIARQVQRMDEYQRRLTMESLSLAAAITAAITFTYGFLEIAGYPRLSMFVVWGIMGSAWAIMGWLRCWAAKR
ncbi:hypothetical protein ACFFKC_18145 [Pseudoduganella danionis]|uniref:Uncharacterized protein n=1 Tax=Pseudoduganella danionis TaxID=1890295 RepID=A0ABW9SNM5_9BURK|nr:hypothetical protein [Pseudoduganella danionis]MTW33797.1 hypothetical protein [Pseudoduganella danionis]